MKANPISEMSQFVADYQKAYLEGELQKEAMDEAARVLIEETACTLNKWFTEANVGLVAYVTHKLPSGQTTDTPVIRLRGRSGCEYGGALLAASVPGHRHPTHQIEGCFSAYIYEQPRLIHGYSSREESVDAVKQGYFASLEEALKSRRIEERLKYAIDRESK